MSRQGPESISSRLKPRSLASSLAHAIVALSATSCLQNTLPLDTTSSTGSNTTGSVAAAPSVSETNLLQLSLVVRTSSDPSGSLDLIGDGSGSIGTYCSNPDTSSTTSNCACTYHVIRSDGTDQMIDAPSKYLETNLLRCSSTDIPADAKSVGVRIHLLSAGVYSNEFAFSSNSGGGTLNLLDPSSFIPAKRYQCRDSLFINYLLDQGSAGGSNIYDPIMSEDPTLAYPLNFYTSNPGLTIAAYVNAQAQASSGGSSGSGWNCPAQPNDPREGMDLRVFSVVPDSQTNSKVIYPVQDPAHDRANFLLARSASGVFTVPVNAYVAPRLISSPGSPMSPPLGYGASPVPRTDGGEDCPNVDIPNFKWVKVWLFRASLPDRKIPSSSAIPTVGKIQCVSNTPIPGSNPGEWTGGAIHRGCGSAGTDIVRANTATDVSQGGFDQVLADRIFGPRIDNGMCLSLANNKAWCSEKVAPFTGTGAGCSVSANVAGFPSKANVTSFPPANSDFLNYYARGTDVYTVKPLAGPTAGVGCGGPQANDPSGLNACRFTDRNQVIAHDRAPTLSSLDGGVSRFDFLFVVSPPSIMVNDFKQSRPQSLPYTPYRFYSRSLCQSNDPDVPSFPGDCSSNNIVRYGLKYQDVSSNGDAPAGDPGRLPVFPVCALQPKP